METFPLNVNHLVKKISNEKSLSHVNGFQKLCLEAASTGITQKGFSDSDASKH